MSKLLLLSLFLLSVASSGIAATAPEEPAIPGSSGMSMYGVSSEPSPDFDRIQVNNSLVTDNVCFNIHAFLFKADDDRVPKLVGETTCMPANRAVSKTVNRGTPAKLIPATGGDTF